MSSDIKTLVAEFLPGRQVSYTKSVYRYDTGRVLKIEGLSLPAAYEVHFSNSPQNDAYVAIGDENGVPIPDAVLRNGNTMYAWVYVQDETAGVTVRTIITHVIEKSKPGNVTPTPAEKTLIDQAIEALNLAKDAGEGDQMDVCEICKLLGDDWEMGEDGKIRHTCDSCAHAQTEEDKDQRGD